ncbi:MAG: glycosyltransferase family 4 protein [Candidatus Omnitrophica bacterium]|nr:glycosyltransferase family 4 protein [Candidatus Omnitrophota bacterium]
MRLAFDGRILAHPYSGIGVYLLNLLQRFKERDAGKIFLYTDRPLLPEYQRQTADYTVELFGQKHRKHWGRWLVARQLRKNGVDLYHCLWNKGVPLGASCPVVVTIHDVFPLLFPEDHGGETFGLKSWRRRWKYQWNLFLDMSRANRIITISECTKKDIVGQFPVFGEKIDVILDGVDFQECRQVASQDVEDWKKHFGLDQPYLISILGRIAERRKNCDRFIKSFQQFRKSYPETALLIIGCGTTAPIEKERSVRVLENIPRKALLSLVTGAEFMVHPTLYEGFGLPVLEAMACGTPVIAGEGSSVTELFDGAALLVDPKDTALMAASMKRLMSDESLRNQCRVLGKKRAEEFTWERTAEQTLELYRRLLKD